jgi:hypothetical protein
MNLSAWFFLLFEHGRPNFFRLNPIGLRAWPGALASLTRSKSVIYQKTQKNVKKWKLYLSPFKAESPNSGQINDVFNKAAAAGFQDEINCEFDIAQARL